MSSLKRIAIALAAVLLVLILASPRLLPPLGELLIADEPPTKSDALLVLAGGREGTRILHGAKLVQAGFAPRVLVSGPYKIYGRNEADLAIDFAVSKGLPREIFEPGYLPAFSTEDEARQWHQELTRRGARKLLLVTSNYHTARARRIFRAAMPEIEVHTSAAPDQDFELAGWWKKRQSQKTFVNEAMKEIARHLGL